MRPKSFLIKALIMVMCALPMSGCIAVVAGGVGLVGGYAISRDTFEGITNKGQDEIWDAAYRVVSIMGTVVEDRRKQGELLALINGANVTVTVIPVNLTNTKLRIKARKNIFPRIGVAQEIYTKIINQLEQ